MPSIDHNANITCVMQLPPRYAISECVMRSVEQMCAEILLNDMWCDVMRYHEFVYLILISAQCACIFAWRNEKCIANSMQCTTFRHCTYKGLEWRMLSCCWWRSRKIQEKMQTMTYAKDKILSRMHITCTNTCNDCAIMAEWMGNYIKANQCFMYSWMQLWISNSN